MKRDALLAALLILMIGALCIAAPAEPTAYRIDCTRKEDGATITSHGWCFAVEGRFVTAAHVVERGECFILVGDERYPASVARADAVADVAILSSAFRPRGVKLATLEASKPILSFHVRGVKNGESGSPLLLNGEAVGMVRSFDTSGNGTCVSAAEIRRVMEEK